MAFGISVEYDASEGEYRGLGNYRIDVTPSGAEVLSYDMSASLIVTFPVPNSDGDAVMHFVRFDDWAREATSRGSGQASVPLVVLDNDQIQFLRASQLNFGRWLLRQDYPFAEQVPGVLADTTAGGYTSVVVGITVDFKTATNEGTRRFVTRYLDRNKVNFVQFEEVAEFERLFEHSFPDVISAADLASGGDADAVRWDEVFELGQPVKG